MKNLSSIEIELENAAWYRQPENQDFVWQEVVKTIEEMKLSREKLLNDMSLKFSNPKLKVTMPLLGDIEGVQTYLIPPIELMGSGRWVSLYLKADAAGNQLHAPTRLSERVRMLHLWLLITQTSEA